MGNSMGDSAVDALPATYQSRHLHALGSERVGGYTLKVYSITVEEEDPDPAVMHAALVKANEYLTTQRAQTPQCGIDWWQLPTHGAGFMTVHIGRDAVFSLLDIWVDGAMLRHHVWVAPLDRPTAFESFRQSDLTMCVWELAVTTHERSAWLEHMFRPPAHRNPDAYLADVLSGRI
jgi:hypothetical protein